MTVGKAMALTAAFIGVFVVGVALGPSIMDRVPNRAPTAAAEPAQPTTAASAAAPAPARAPARNTAGVRTKASSSKRAIAATSRVPASEPRLHDRLKPVLNSGARMTVAAEGFRTGEEFAAVAHAARNTHVPFMVLKHRVITEGRTLEEALREAKPDLDAKAEVARARAAAKSDVAAIAG